MWTSSGRQYRGQPIFDVCEIAGVLNGVPIAPNRRPFVAYAATVPFSLADEAAA